MARWHVSMSFPDVVDSRFTGQVDSLPDTVDIIPDSDVFPSIHNHITKRHNGKTAQRDVDL
jgi:hypothetical protein